MLAGRVPPYHPSVPFPVAGSRHGSCIDLEAVRCLFQGWATMFYNRRCRAFLLTLASLWAHGTWCVLFVTSLFGFAGLLIDNRLMSGMFTHCVHLCGTLGTLATYGECILALLLL